MLCITTNPRLEGGGGNGKCQADLLNAGEMLLAGQEQADGSLIRTFSEAEQTYEGGGIDIRLIPVCFMSTREPHSSLLRHIWSTSAFLAALHNQ